MCWLSYANHEAPGFYLRDSSFNLGLGGAFHSIGIFGVESYEISLAIPVLLFIWIAGIAFGIKGWFVERMSRQGRCIQCGYDLTGNSNHRCPECGMPFGRQDMMVKD